jgi:hypothetical protein
MNRIVLALVLVWATFSAQAHKVTIDFKHTGSFAAYKTYSWAGPPEAATNQLMAGRVVAFVEEALAAKHLRRVPSGGDLLIHFRIDVQEQPQFITYTDQVGFGFGWDWGSSVSTTVSTPFLTSILTVDMVDARQGQLVFQGVSSQSFSSRPEKNTRKFAEAVNRIFAKYPPL